MSALDASSVPGDPLAGDPGAAPVVAPCPAAPTRPPRLATTSRTIRSQYTGTTLREHYGLPRPENPYTRARLAAAEVPA